MTLDVFSKESGDEQKSTLSPEKRAEWVPRLLIKEGPAVQIARRAGVSEQICSAGGSSFSRLARRGADRARAKEVNRLHSALADRDQVVGELTIKPLHIFPAVLPFVKATTIIISYLQSCQNMEQSEVIKSLAALAQPHRLKAFRALVVAGSEGLIAGAIAEELAIPAATLSFHLKELVHAGLITQERSSRNLIYRADFAQMNRVLAYLTENCCQGEVCLEASAAQCNC